MYGLVMIKEYFDELLDSKKTYDARSYDTYKRGSIALMDTKKSTVINFVDLVGTHKISAEEYCSWHATDKWGGMIFQVEDMNVIYYAYDFENPRRLAVPIKIEKSRRIWTVIQDSVQSQLIFRLDHLKG